MVADLVIMTLSLYRVEVNTGIFSLKAAVFPEPVNSIEILFHPMQLGHVASFQFSEVGMPKTLES